MSRGDAMRLFVTVGAQMPFDRMIRAVDEWAAGARDVELFAQVGETGFQPRNIPWAELLSPDEFRAKLSWASLIVSHAGMGSILMSLQYGKPILVMPRSGALRETRNDHQVATARHLRSIARIAVAMDEGELLAMLSNAATIETGKAISQEASPELLATTRQFILDGAIDPVSSYRANRIQTRSDCDESAR